MSLNLSVGVLYDCQNFIELCDNRSFSLNEVRSAFESRYQAAPIAVVLEMMRAGAWLSFEDDGELKLTARGRQILQCDNPVEALRLQIMDFVVNVKPTWSSLLPKGRSETLQFLTSDARQCFNEAALTDDYDEATIRFWDQIASLSRGRLNDVLLQIGRVGERLSFRYENDRTGRPPTWKSIESNLAGYDILSVVSMNGSEALKIEVRRLSALTKGRFT
jgi:hypothetical protein